MEGFEREVAGMVAIAILDMAVAACEKLLNALLRTEKIDSLF